MVIVLPNQTVSLIKNGESFSDYNYRITTQKWDYCQQVRDGQLTYFQVQVTPETGTNLFTNGDFLINLNGWTQTGSWVWSSVLGAGSSNVATLSQNIIVTANRTHRIDFDVTAMSIGGKIGVFPLMTHSTIGGTQTVDASMGLGSYSLYFIPTAGGLQTIAFQNLNGGQSVFIDNLAIYELTEPIFTIRDCETQTPQAALGVVQRFEDRITYSGSWTEIEDGCYNICLENAGDFEYNYAERAMCLTLENGESLLAEEGDCITWYG